MQERGFEMISLDCIPFYSNVSRISQIDYNRSRDTIVEYDTFQDIKARPDCEANLPVFTERYLAEPE